MNAKQENKLSMYLAVVAVCDRNNSTWQSLQAFADAYTDFSTHVTNIQDIAQTQAADITGLSVDKQQLREAMADTATEVANAVFAYARKAKNNELSSKVDVNRSAIVRGRDTVAADIARNIYAAANANVASLSAYGVTAAKLKVLKANIDAYAGSIAKPREARATGVTATQRLADEFDAADAILTEQMDTLVSQFKSDDSTFVTDYQHSRLIVDSAGNFTSRSKVKPPPAPVPKPAPAGTT